MTMDLKFYWRTLQTQWSIIHVTNLKTVTNGTLDN